jgi:hypothetical protein
MMATITEYEAKALIWQIDGVKPQLANGYVELSDSEEYLDVTLYYRMSQDTPKQRIDATFKLHKASSGGAIEPVKEDIYRE